jgi:hypothetical protein
MYKVLNKTVADFISSCEGHPSAARADGVLAHHVALPDSVRHADAFLWRILLFLGSGKPRVLLAPVIRTLAFGSWNVVIECIGLKPRVRGFKLLKLLQPVMVTTTLLLLLAPALVRAHVLVLLLPHLVHLLVRGHAANRRLRMPLVLLLRMPLVLLLRMPLVLLLRMPLVLLLLRMPLVLLLLRMPLVLLLRMPLVLLLRMPLVLLLRMPLVLLLRMPRVTFMFWHFR